MAHKTLVNGTSYEITGGKDLIGGTAYSKKKGRTLIDGTGYDILFGRTLIIKAKLIRWQNITSDMQVIFKDGTTFNSDVVYSSGDQSVRVPPGTLVACRFNNYASGYLYFNLNGKRISRNSLLNDTMVFRINGDTTITMEHGSTGGSAANSKFTFYVDGDAEYVSQSNDVPIWE